MLKIWESYITELYDRPNRPETLEVESEEEVGTDEKGSHILQSEVEKAIKEMRNRKTTGDDDTPGDVLKLLGRRWFENIDKAKQHWRVAPGLHRSYNDCVKEENKSYQIQRLSHNQPYCTCSKDNSKDT